MKPYPRYRPSGVEWLGEVPEGWEVKRLGVIAEELQTGPFGSQIHTEDYISGGIPLINPSNIVDGQIVPDDEISVSEETASRLASHALLPGDIVLARRGELGRCAIVPDNSPVFLCGTGSLRLRLKKDAALPRFTAECIRTPRVREWLSLQSVGSTMENLNATIASRIQIPLPPLAEQRGIAGFLDREVGKIDALIAEQRQLIALLAEKRQATISTAVTRGLSPDTPLKPSGVEGLGDIPEGWEVVKLKQLIADGTSITYGIVQAGPEHEGGIPYIRTSDLSGSALPSSGLPLTSPEIESAYARSRVYPGDIVVAIRATIGKALPVPDSLPLANLTQGTAKISPGENCCRDFLLFALASDAAQTYFDLMAKGATFREITLDALRRLPLPIPPKPEQFAIAQFLSETLESIDSTTATASEAIALLLERRAALISAAVTGKIDVQDLSS